jgi:hypothetical protein
MYQSRGCINLLCYRTTFHISGVGVLALLCVIIILALLARDRVCLFIGRAGGQITFQKTKGFGFLILPGLEYCSQYDQIVQEGARALTFGITILVVTAYVPKREKSVQNPIITMQVKAYKQHTKRLLSHHEDLLAKPIASSCCWTANSV